MKAGRPTVQCLRPPWGLRLTNEAGVDDCGANIRGWERRKTGPNTCHLLIHDSCLQTMRWYARASDESSGVSGYRPPHCSAAGFASVAKNRRYANVNTAGKQPRQLSVAKPHLSTIYSMPQLTARSKHTWRWVRFVTFAITCTRGIQCDLSLCEQRCLLLQPPSGERGKTCAVGCALVSGCVVSASLAGLQKLAAEHSSKRSSPRCATGPLEGR